ncbi:MAG: UDP-N-acetylmuramoyl-tripeptide--D-alanyl-D-alanine ligase [Undibacterium sp.]
MKIKMLLARLLGMLARLVLRSRRPVVVGITGSVGKSSAKEATALVLAKHFSIFSSPGNYNNEFGLPLAIIGITSPGRSPIAWVLAVSRAIAIILRWREYPEVLVLEMGIDHPGDMDYLLSIARPDIGVLTHVSESHLAQFDNLDHIAREKGKLLAAIPENGTAIVNADNERALHEGDRSKAKVLSYGLAPNASLSVDNIRILQEAGRIEGLSFKLNSGGKSIPVRLPGIVGRHHISAVLAAAAVGIALKLNLVEIAAALVEFETLPGRMKLLDGDAGIRIIDDTYNASRASTEAALATLRELIAPRKVVILGDMLEIGPTSDEVHRSLRDAVISSGASVFVGVGQHMRFLADALRGTNFPEKSIFHFPDPVTALERLHTVIRPSDLVLVKGSQGLRMELVVEALIGEAKIEGMRSRLCRQSATWRTLPFQSPEEWL